MKLSENTLGNTLPDCSNPQCIEKAMILIGRQFFCGECAVKVNKILENEQQERDMRILDKLSIGKPK